jgi:hypothetical protein
MSYCSTACQRRSSSGCIGDPPRRTVVAPPGERATDHPDGDHNPAEIRHPAKRVPRRDVELIGGVFLPGDRDRRMRVDGPLRLSRGSGAVGDHCWLVGVHHCCLGVPAVSVDERRPGHRLREIERAVEADVLELDDPFDRRCCSQRVGNLGPKRVLRSGADVSICRHEKFDLGVAQAVGDGVVTVSREDVCLDRTDLQRRECRHERVGM